MAASRLDDAQQRKALSPDGQPRAFGAYRDLPELGLQHGDALVFHPEDREPFTGRMGGGGPTCAATFAAIESGHIGVTEGSSAVR